MPASTPASFEHLISRTALGDQAAFHQLYLQSSPRLLAVAIRILTQRQLAEDVLQEAFLNIWRQAGTYRPDLGQPMTWMSRIVRNRALDWLRRSGSRVQTVSIDADDADEPALQIADDRPLPPDQLLQNAEMQHLDNCLGTLDERQSLCIKLAFLDGLSHPELALHLGSPLGTVKAWVRRGLEKLRKCLDT